MSKGSWAWIAVQARLGMEGPKLGPPRRADLRIRRQGLPLDTLAILNVVAICAVEAAAGWVPIHV